jgi:hypothetical protein
MSVISDNLKAILTEITALIKICESKAVQEFTTADCLKSIKSLLRFGSENLPYAARAINRIIVKFENYQYACAALISALQKIFHALCDLLPEDLQLDLFEVEDFHQPIEKKRIQRCKNWLTSTLRRGWEATQTKWKQLTLADAAKLANHHMR